MDDGDIMNSERQHLVLVPGLICNERLWTHQISGLEALADVSVTAEHTKHDNVGDIAAAVLSAAPARFALAGLSFGGYIAMEIMRQAPARVDRLALLDTRAQADSDENVERRALLIEQSRIGKFLGVTDKLLELFVHPARLRDRSLVEEVKRMAAEVGRDGFIRQQTAIMNRPDSFEGLAGVVCPTLVLVGRQDALTPVADHQAMHSVLSNSDLAVIEDCGHLSTMERPAAVNAALRDWLRS
jgi:pimeloyl-ACP methyl ester carboxylesterase